MLMFLLASALAIAAPLENGQTFTLHSGFQHQRQTAGRYEAWEAPISLEYAVQGPQNAKSSNSEKLGLRIAASTAVGPRAYISPWDVAWGQRWRGLFVVRGAFQARYFGAELGMGYFSSRVTKGVVPSAELWLGNPQLFHVWWRFFPGVPFGEVSRSAVSGGLTQTGDTHQVQLGVQSSSGGGNPSAMASLRLRVRQLEGPWDLWLGGSARVDFETVFAQEPNKDAAVGVQLHLHRRASAAPVHDLDAPPRER